MKILWIDSETSGLDPVHNGIIQLALIVDIDAGMTVEKQNFFISPEGSIDDNALAISGITREQIAGFQSEKIMKQPIRQFLCKYVNPRDKTDYFIPAGYNVNFDMRMLEELWKRQGDKYLYSFFRAHLDVMDMVAMWKFMGFNIPNEDWKLESVARALNIPFTLKAHDALVDIEKTREIAYKLVDMKKQRRLISEV